MCLILVSMKKVRLLLVEDEAIIALMEKKELEQKYYEVEHVFKGEDAVRVLTEEKKPFDAVLMDIDLGKGMDGTEASEIILKELDIPIIFLSARTEPEIVEKNEKITSYGYVVKNSGPIVLDASIKMALKLFQVKQSRAAMVHMLDVAPNSITVHTTEGVFLYANKKTYDLHGWTEEEFMEINLHDLDVPDSEDLLEERFQLIFQEGSAVFQVEHFRKDGTTFPLEVSAKIVDWQGRSAVLSIATDITDRKNAERSLKRSEERVQALLAANPDIMLIFDRQGRILDYHASDEKELFADGATFLNRHVSDVLPDYLAELTMEKLKELFSAGGLLTYGYRAEHRGRERWYESRLVPCGKDCALAIIRDITERR